MKALLAIVIAAAAFAAPVLACGDEWMGENLVVTPRVKAGLRAAYLAANPALRPSRVRGPLPGRTYYGSYSGTRYALATFTTGSGPAYATIFRTDARGRWRIRQQTRGEICTNIVPIDLVMVWWLEPKKAGCFVEPL